MSGLTAWNLPDPLYVLFQWGIMFYTSMRLVGYFTSHIINLYTRYTERGLQYGFSTMINITSTSLYFPAPGPIPVPGRLLTGAYMFDHIFIYPVLPLW